MEEGNTKYHCAGNCLIETESKKIIAGCKASIIPTDGSATSIVDNAFSWSKISGDLVRPDCITEIGASAFAGCSELTSVVIGNNVTTLDWTFEGCTSLTNVVIGENVTIIAPGSFMGCNLTSVTFRNTEGWFIPSDPNATSGTPLSSEDLSNPSTAATYLRSTYGFDYWKCNK